MLHIIKRKISQQKQIQNGRDNGTGNKDVKTAMINMFIQRKT